MSNDLLEIAPYNPTGWQILIKTLLGLIVGIFIAFLIFITLILVGGVIQEALANSIAGSDSLNPLLPLILIIIAFVGIVVGMILIAGMFNLLYTDKYYDMGKMFSLTLMINIALFILFIPLYAMFSSSPNELFFVLGFHIIFAVFVSYTAMEMSTNPNYAAVHLIGTAIAMTIALLLFWGAYKLIDINESSTVRILLALPPILAYFCLPLFHGAWEKIYYKFYSMGNNFFYIPSLSEVLVDETEEADISVDM